MPKHSKRKRSKQTNCEKARDLKRSRNSDENSFSGPVSDVRSDEELSLTHLAFTLDDALDTDDETLDPSFDLDTRVRSDCEHIIDTFCEVWVCQLERDDMVSLAVFLCFQLAKHFKLGETKAAELSALMTGKSDKTVREWRKYFCDNGQIPECKQGHYQRSGVVSHNEDLNRKATKYIRKNADVKGQPNLTVGMFCQWVNEDLLPNTALEPGFLRKISLETGRKWMHELGFEVVTKKKGTFSDGHEREDVVQYRKSFLRKMVGLGFLNPTNAPTEEAKKALPNDLEPPPTEVIQKTILIFHDETTFQANDDQSTLWASKGTTVIRPKSKGSGIMVSDFITERDGYLALTIEEVRRAQKVDPMIRMCA